MKPAAFFRDRLAYIGAYLTFGSLTVAIIQLDLSLSGATLRLGNVLYVGLLGLVGLGIFLAVEYQRDQAFNRRLAALTGDEPLDQLAMLPNPTTHQQRLYAQAWASLYARLRAELREEQERGRRSVSLISQWAHHMKTPVAVIDLELQKARTTDPALVSIGEENQRLRHSIQMLLNAIRIEDFAADFRIEPVDLTALIRQIINDQKRAFILSRVYPRLAPAPPHTVETDHKWLRFVIEQLVSNAIKYAARPEGEAQGQVTFTISPDGPDTLLEIADNGIGIPTEDLGRLFSPFFTGTNGRRYPQSTGMGLYLAKEGCRRLGHQIALTSRPHQGTTVTIRFTADRSIAAGMPRTEVTRL
ncbi:MAG: two-component sensor histidine kinase [Symbiobacteriaceae bacterium]|jgi:signal transduction histidine kinase|nr:two-component sensor histidine kinase [Symbiobacteriaceae bacterium]